MNENMFNDETQEMQAQACYDTAMQRIQKEFPKVNPDNYSDRVWFAVVGMVVHNGYKAAMEYAQTAPVHV